VRLEEAGAADLPAIADLMNRAYRGPQGWATEKGLIAGPRTDAGLLAGDLRAAPDARLLAAREDGAIRGCVWLEPLGDAVWQLGALTVEPAHQAAGSGRALLAGAEAWAAARGARTARLTVVHVRDGLIAWYVRRGYRPTGETRPWPYHDARFGTPLRPGLYFVVLDKELS